MIVKIIMTFQPSGNFYLIDPCNHKFHSFIIGGQEYPLNSVDYVLTINTTQANLPYATPKVKDIVDCVSVFYPMDLSDQQNGNVWILGDTFLSKFYLIFDRDNMQVGIAKQQGVNYD